MISPGHDACHAPSRGNGHREIQDGDCRAWQEPKNEHNFVKICTLTRISGKKFACDGSKYATVEDGWTGLAFIETCLKSNKKKGAWDAMPKKI